MLHLRFFNINFLFQQKELSIFFALLIPSLIIQFRAED